MPKPIPDETIVKMDQYRAPRASVHHETIDWLSIPEVRDMVSMIASEDAEGMSDFLTLDEGTPVRLEVEITNPKVAQAVLYSVGMNESLIPGMRLHTVKLNPEKETPHE